MEEQIELCNLILEKIKKIKKIPHPKNLDEELVKFLSVFKKIKQTKYELFDDFKNFILKNTTKKFHFDQYKDLPKPIIYILYIFLSELNLLFDLIHQYNSININYTEEYKILWKELLDENFTILCRQFGDQLPCMEGYTSDLENGLNFMRNEPSKPADIEIKLILSKEDFKDDGGFNARVTGLLDWQIIGLTMKTFRMTLCGLYNNCEIDHELIRQAYNLPNYKTYLDYIDFYKKYPTITEEFVLSTIEDGIDNSEDSIPKGKFCCKQELMYGGKKNNMKTRYKRLSKNNKLSIKKSKKWWFQ